MFDWFRKKEKAPPPADAGALRRQADSLLAQDDFAGAARAYLAALERDPHDAKALTSLGFASMMQGAHADAMVQLQRALSVDASSHDAHYMLATLHETSGDLAAALHHLQQAVKLMPSFEPAVRNRVRLLFTTGNASAAHDALAEGLRHIPGSADLHADLGNLHLSEKHVAEAAESYGRAAAIDPTHEAHARQAGLLVQLGRLPAAAAVYRDASNARPRDPGLLSDLAHVLYLGGQFEPAVQACARALTIDPGHFGAHNNMGNALFQLGRLDEAVVAYGQAIAARPGDATTCFNLAQLLAAMKRPKEAIEAFARVLAIDTDHPGAYGAWVFVRLAACEWQDIEPTFDELARRIDADRPAVPPFNMLAVPLSRAQQLRCAATYAARAGHPPATPITNHTPGPRIRIGYFSADFHEHATAYLMAEMLERHDRRRFEIVAFSFGPRSTGPMRQRLEKAFDRFVDVLDLSDADTVARARELQIDIAVDLKGYTQDCRPGIFARRAAPLQLNFLGYPGSMGAPFIDYLVADAVVVPPGAAVDYSEKIVFMPHSYQPNDSRRTISPRVFTREEVGLPPRGFVFCSFNNNYKITPDVFAAWMRLLQAVPGSVLWLLQDSPVAAANLRARATSLGIDPERLVFAARMPMEEHLARHALADLFLDTLYCNAHTTASDALWAGLPLLTCAGSTFAARVAASLLHAAGVAELVTTRLADYEALALELARDPARLQDIRRRLVESRTRSPLFDAGLFTAHLESGYESIWSRHLAGMAPDHVVVPRFLVQ